MNSDIALTKRAENRIRNRMGQRIRIRMPISALIRRYTHAPKHKLASFDEPVRIDANSDP